MLLIKKENKRLRQALNILKNKVLITKKKYVGTNEKYI